MLIVKECLHTLPSAVSVLCFDTLFHRTIPQYRRVYAIKEPDHPTPVPLVRYGFHGLSYGNILKQMAEELGKEEKEVNLVVAHLGSGGSCCLIQGGESKQTTMGVTPLEGTSSLLPLLLLETEPFLCRSSWRNSFGHRRPFPHLPRRPQQRRDDRLERKGN
jgi:acetate kinase